MFDAKVEKDKIIKFIQDYYKNNNLGGVVIGISGGKDSAVVAGLFTEALGKENVLGVTLPCHSNEDDKNDAKLIADHFGFKLLNVDLTEVNDVFKEEINKLGDFTEEETKNSDINLKPRLRMATMYYLAALYSNIKGKTYIVAGTSNLCEYFVGYFTKGGDGVSDISVGFKYSDVSKLLNYEYIDAVTKQKIIYKHYQNVHKYDTPVYIKSDWR